MSSGRKREIESDSDLDEAGRNERKRPRRAHITEEYPIPDAMNRLLDENLTSHQIEQRVAKLIPSDDLNEENYAERFHMFLHLEEIEHMCIIKAFNSNEAVLDKCPDRMSSKSGRESCYSYQLTDENRDARFLDIGKCI